MVQCVVDVSILAAARSSLMNLSSLPVTDVIMSSTMNSVAANRGLVPYSDSDTETENSTYRLRRNHSRKCFQYTHSCALASS